MDVPLSSNVLQALGALVGALAAEGYSLSSVEESSSFGNFAATFTNGQRTAVVSRDRGQFIVQGERSVLEPAGLWRTFSGTQGLLPPLLEWLQAGQGNHRAG